MRCKYTIVSNPLRIDSENKTSKVCHCYETACMGACQVLVQNKVIISVPIHLAKQVSRWTFVQKDNT